MMMQEAQVAAFVSPGEPILEIPLNADGER